MFILSALVFLAVSLAIVSVFIMFAPSRAEQRLRAIGLSEPRAEWAATVVKLAGPFARLSLPDGEWEQSPLRVRFMNAGIRRSDARIFYFAAKTILPIVFAATALMAMRTANHSFGPILLFAMALAALIGCYLPNVMLSGLARSRRREIFENFPDAADLMLVCVEAGLGLDAALAKVAEEIRRKSLPLAEELHLTILELRAGASREQSLRNLATRTGVDEIGTFAAMLTQADRFGTSIGDSLRVFSEDLRHKRQIAAEEKAAKLPTKMLFPLVLFIFPSVIMVVLGPAIIQVVRTMAPMLGGR